MAKIICNPLRSSINLSVSAVGLNSHLLAAMCFQFLLWTNKGHLRKGHFDWAIFPLSFMKTSDCTVLMFDSYKRRAGRFMFPQADRQED